MKTIIVINDNSTSALRAGMAALNIAERVNADLLVANELKVNEGAAINNEILAGIDCCQMLPEETESGLAWYLKCCSKSKGNSDSCIRELDISDFSETKLAELIIQNNIWMIIKGSEEYPEANAVISHLNIQSILNRVRCPLLLVPEKFNLKNFEQIVYMTDLRYCRYDILGYLAQLAWPYRANIMVDHISAKGLPDMTQNYAVEVFSEISGHVKYDKVYFNNIKERDIQRAADVIINGMHADLLTLVNHRFHLDELLGRHIPQILPDQITIPLLIFPS